MREGKEKERVGNGQGVKGGVKEKLDGRNGQEGEGGKRREAKKREGGRRGGGR